MIADIVMRRRETKRLRVRNEVDLVPAIRELDPEFGRNHSTSAVGGIARDSYFHSLSRIPELDVSARFSLQEIWCKLNLSCMRGLPVLGQIRVTRLARFGTDTLCENCN